MLPLGVGRERTASDRRAPRPRSTAQPFDGVDVGTALVDGGQGKATSSDRLAVPDRARPRAGATSR